MALDDVTSGQRDSFYDDLYSAIRVSAHEQGYSPGKARLDRLINEKLDDVESMADVRYETLASRYIEEHKDDENFEEDEIPDDDAEEMYDQSVEDVLASFHSEFFYDYVDELANSAIEEMKSQGVLQDSDYDSLKG